jgi:hypothetical protein
MVSAVRVFRTVTVALGIDASEESRTVPTIDAVGWASAFARSNTTEKRYLMAESIYPRRCQGSFQVGLGLSVDRGR